MPRALTCLLCLAALPVHAQGFDTMACTLAQGGAEVDAVCDVAPTPEQTVIGGRIEGGGQFLVMLRHETGEAAVLGPSGETVRGAYERTETAEGERIALPEGVTVALVRRN